MNSEPAPKGVYAAVSTPVTPSYRPDLPRFLQHCEWLLQNGCDGLAPLGTTSEANSFGMSDRIGIIEAIAASRLPMDRMIVGSGSCSIEDAVQVSTAAIEAGANKLLMLPPFYYKSPSEEGLYRFFASVADSLRGKAPRIYLYNFPMMSAVPVTLSLFKRLRDAYPGIFVGLKDSSGDFANTKAFIDEFEDFEAFSGSETLAVKTLEAGGWGCISATTNVTASVVAARINAKSEQEQSQLDRKVNQLRGAVASFGNISGTKAVLADYWGDREWARTVPPNVSLTEDQTRRLVEAMDGIADLRRLFR